MRGGEEAADDSQVRDLGRWVSVDAVCSHREHGKKRNCEGEEDSALDVVAVSNWDCPVGHLTEG